MVTERGLIEKIAVRLCGYGKERFDFVAQGRVAVAGLCQEGGTGLGLQGPRLVKYLLDLVEGREVDTPWYEIVES